MFLLRRNHETTILQTNFRDIGGSAHIDFVEVWAVRVKITFQGFPLVLKAIKQSSIEDIVRPAAKLVLDESEKVVV